MSELKPCCKELQDQCDKLEDALSQALHAVSIEKLLKWSTIINARNILTEYRNRKSGVTEVRE